ncbi:biopolymer transport protein ExbD [Arenibacter algicola]|jgi:biopolymer transport protein ExbD|uniref:Biopolymer transport protein ExbD n=2 Tax=Arenibacter TaxID=178469 RepID=A0A221UXP9_9FLAO|nr:MULTISPECIES: biopolymer transporter ExbD [Arenibacter]HCO83550.1 biopolymer transporter ExbD [Arenibacter sp.]ASO05671.1 biopolymer transport protein ExbD/TolR [Arenibacter algicola]MDX1758453.1 biopolymer transporter ExbD [Arenibacter algicola]MDX1767639.1 biopolymer transporter ExbD [Arenibacter troitsensis]SMG06545.1 Biopolymer transport protein ExbD [Arenibacter troitsensis]|tara:strand:+ start:286 stop:768 length:483 start_codon:yes stop_codon:yes gene_type:complete
MSKFNKKKDAALPAVNTASLPDIVFMLLFFFMTVTVMKDSTLKVENVLPNASEIKKLEKKDRVIYIYVGKPTREYEKTYGTESKIQLNDKFADASEVGDYILMERAKKPQELQNVLTTALKVDKEANMGIISDIKQELRKVNALKVNYTTYEGDAFRNLQ